MKLTDQSRNGIGMPLTGFGTYQLSHDQAEACVSEALKAGFRHIDSAESYGNEEGCGRGIKASGIAREEIFITTKVFPGYKLWGAPEKTRPQIIETLKNQLKQLSVDYVDLYLIHAPLAEIRLEQWSALTELKKSGLTRHIGVSNYDETRITEILDANLEKPQVNQIEFHPIYARHELTGFMRKNAIEAVAYSSLAPLSSWRMEEGQGGEVLAGIKEECQAIVRNIAEKLHVSDARVLLRWGLQHGYCVLTKTGKPERIRENLKLFDFEIPQSDMETLDKMNQNKAIAWAASGINPMDSAPTLSV